MTSQARATENKKAESDRATLYAWFAIEIVGTDTVISSTGTGYHHWVGAERRLGDGIAAIMVQEAAGMFYG